VGYTKPNVTEDTLNWRNRLLKYIDGGQGVMTTYTTATLPDPATMAGRVVFVSDAAPGQHFQGSNGTSWVYMG
jgi:hypothetical protein